MCELTDCIYVFQRGWTALHLAAQEGNIDVAKLLIEAKAQVNIQEEVCCSYTTHIVFKCNFCAQRGWAALHLAAQEGKVDVVRILIKAKAQVNLQEEVYMLLLQQRAK